VAETPYRLAVHPALPYSAGALEPAPDTPEQFRRMIANELDRRARVIRDAGIRQE